MSGASSRSKRRADGTLRPKVKRARRKRRLRQRAEWLAQFEPGARERFFHYADIEQAMFLRPFARGLGLSEEDAAPYLAEIAEGRRWMKLRLRDGRVVGIAPPRTKA